MSQPILDGFDANLSVLDRDLLTVCDEVTATVRTTPGYSLFTGIHVGHIHYRDLGAHCACHCLRLFKFADDAYSLCAAHGLQALGYLVRDYTPAVRR